MSEKKGANYNITHPRDMVEIRVGFANSAISEAKAYVDKIEQELQSLKTENARLSNLLTRAKPWVDTHQLFLSEDDPVQFEIDMWLVEITNGIL